MAAPPNRPSTGPSWRRPAEAVRSLRSVGYHRRNVLPAALIVLVLVVAGVVTWTVVLTNASSSSVTACNPPAAGGGTVQARGALDDTAAAAPGDIAVTVLNAAGQRGQAQLAAVELGEVGITEAGQPTNDPLYPALDLQCVGQIRYGPDGAAAARTLSVVIPCAELVEDGRAGTAVDFSLGSNFRDVSPSAGVTDALRALSRRNADGAAPPGTDPAALTALRDEVSCST